MGRDCQTLSEAALTQWMVAGLPLSSGLSYARGAILQLALAIRTQSAPIHTHRSGPVARFRRTKAPCMFFRTVSKRDRRAKHPARLRIYSYSRGLVAEEWNPMNDQTLVDESGLSAATSDLETIIPKADPNWKPHPCGHSKEELRAILDEVMA